MKNEKLEYKMYGLVPYNISPIQQAIQFGHAVQEFNNNYFATDGETGEEFANWRILDKTFIILNGGTTNKRGDIVTGEPIGTLNQHLITLQIIQVSFATFHEPDLGDQLTAVVFLVDERVFNKKKYPDFEFVDYGDPNDEYDSQYDEWVDSLGGLKNVKLREFLEQFQLA